VTLTETVDGLFCPCLGLLSLFPFMAQLLFEILTVTGK
jgi:hypothetical protein